MAKNHAFESSFKGVKYVGNRGTPFPNVFYWLNAKRKGDDVGNLWRVHDKLYNLEPFIERHPGGKDWIEFSRGTDITEAFESSHIVDFQNVEKILAKYYVRDTDKPRNSPYTFKENGFYRTLKRRVQPILKSVGTNPTPEFLLLEDGLMVLYCSLALLSVWTNSTFLQIMAGVVLGMCVAGSHNFYHQKDNIRMYYTDLSPIYSYEWRVSHAFSHHLYPNTVLDFEVIIGEPLIETLPSRDRNWIQKYVAVFYVDLIYFFYGLTQIFVRLISLLQGHQKLRPENLIIFIELAIFTFIAPSPTAAFRAWLVIFMMSSFYFVFITNNSAHHHPVNFHDGDEPRPDPDFGLCQLDATRGKSDAYHKTLFSLLTTLGEHPLHHLFPTICHSKLHHLKPILAECLKEFSEDFPELSQLELFIGTHRQLSRTEKHKYPKSIN